MRLIDPTTMPAVGSIIPSTLTTDWLAAGPGHVDSRGLRAGTLSRRMSCVRAGEVVVR
jgi:hypothetical protein